MFRTIFAFALVAATVTSANAASPQPRPGQYVSEGESGTLIIRRDGPTELQFQIDTVGANCHVCSVSGVIRGTTGHGDSWAGDGSDSKCDISFTSKQSSVVVDSVTQEECRAYCGARAGFDGTYRMPPANCTAGQRQARRDRFLHLYRAHRYLQATITLQTLISQCRDFMHWIEIDKVRNDIALSQYNSGNFDQCIDTLNETLVPQCEERRRTQGGKF
jgi:hypothetical protein